MAPIGLSAKRPETWVAPRAKMSGNSETSRKLPYLKANDGILRALAQRSNR